MIKNFKKSNLHLKSVPFEKTSEFLAVNQMPLTLSSMLNDFIDYMIN